MISVIIPVHNRAHLIRRCLDSVCSQTEKEIEILLIDDHSTDEISEVAKEYKSDSRFAFYHVEEGRGVSAARNLGIEKARGEYVLFVDSDDYFEPDLVQTAKAVMEQEKADLVVCGFCMETDDKKRIKTSRNADKENAQIEIYGNKELLKDVEKTGFGNFAIWGRLFTRELIGECRFPLGVAMSEDVIFMTHIYAKAKKVVYVPKVCFHVVMHSGNIQWSGFNPLTEYDEIHQYEEVLEFFYSQIKDEKSREIARRVWFNGKVQILRRISRKETKMQNWDKKRERAKILKSIRSDQMWVLKHGRKSEKITALMLMVSPRLYTGIYFFTQTYLPRLLSSQKYKD